MRRAGVPDALRTGPFTVSDALAFGITRHDLRGARWRRVRRGVYVYRSIPDDPALELEAVARALPESAVFSGLTSLWLHGLDIGPGKPIEITIPADIGISARASLRVRRVVRLPEATLRRELRTTPLERALLDSARSLPLVRLVAVVDEALRRRMTDLNRLEAEVGDNLRRPGVRRFRRAVQFSDGLAESPMESHLRVLLLQAGLPRPVSQAELRSREGAFLGRVDLYYPDVKLAIEYDGDVHRTQLADDMRRQNAILSAGYNLLRFTRSDLLDRPDAVVRQVRAFRPRVPQRSLPAMSARRAVISR